MNKKILVVFYSRTGNTKKLAEKIARKLDADIEEIIDKKSRKGILGYVFGGRDAFRKSTTEIIFKKDPEKYRLVVIGTPVWAGTVVPAVRTYLIENKSKLKKVAFFCTFGGGAGKTFKEMGEISGKPLATLGLKDKNSEDAKEIDKFCSKLK